MSKRNSYQPTKDDLDNRSRQLDREHPTYWTGRGYEERPADWQERSEGKAEDGRT